MLKSRSHSVRCSAALIAAATLTVASLMQVPLAFAQGVSSPPVVAVHSCPLGVAPGVARCHSLVLVAESSDVAQPEAKP
jgi:hypothetical protein